MAGCMTESVRGGLKGPKEVESGRDQRLQRGERGSPPGFLPCSCRRKGTAEAPGGLRRVDPRTGRAKTVRNNTRYLHGSNLSDLGVETKRKVLRGIGGRRIGGAREFHRQPLQR